MGKLHIIYIDTNPNSPTYNTTSSVTVSDSDICNVDSNPKWVETGSFCETTQSGKTGNLVTYFQDTNENSESYGDIKTIIEFNNECNDGVLGTEPHWEFVDDSEYCELDSNGMNTGYKVYKQKDVNPYSSTYKEERDYKALSNDCEKQNTKPNWTIVSESCNIVPFNGSLVYDGTKNIVEIDDNQFSDSFNATRTINKEDAEKCPLTSDLKVSFKWEKTQENVCGYNLPNEIKHKDVNKYDLYRKFKSYDDGASWVAIDEYNVTIVEENSTDCGYVPPQYRFIDIDEEACDMEAHILCQRQQKQVSLDNGVTWDFVTPYEYQYGKVLEENSTRCGYPIYRWESTDETMCDGYDKYKLERQQVSTDNGQTWTNTEVTRKSELIEHNSFDCGYIPEYKYELVSESCDDESITNIATYKKTFKSFVCDGYDKYGIYSLTLELDGKEYEPNPPFEDNKILLEKYSEDCGANPYSIFIDTTGAEHKLLIEGDVVKSNYLSELPYKDEDSLASVDLSYNVTSIGNSAFDECMNLTSVTMTNEVVTISEKSFYSCKRLSGITLSSNITEIGNYAFCYCSALSDIKFPKKLTKIGEKAFNENVALTSVTFDGTDLEIGNYAFNGDKRLTSISLNNVKTIGSYAFSGCEGITYLYIPSSVESIGYNAFSKVKIHKSNLINASSATGYPWGMTVYEDNGMIIEDNVVVDAEPSIVNADIPDGVTGIGRSAFGASNYLISVTIPDSVTTIGYQAFAGCGKLTSVLIGKGVASIGEFAFEHCNSLKEITYNGTIAEWNSISIASNWLNKTFVTVIKCTDGNINL